MTKVSTKHVCGYCLHIRALICFRDFDFINRYEKIMNFISFGSGSGFLVSLRPDGTKAYQNHILRHSSTVFLPYCSSCLHLVFKRVPMCSFCVSIGMRTDLPLAPRLFIVSHVLLILFPHFPMFFISHVQPSFYLRISYVYKSGS